MTDDGTLKGSERALHFPRTGTPPDPTKCFVLMPIAKGLDEVYVHVVRPALESIGIKCIRADELYTANPIIEDIWRCIQECRWIVADLTGRNPNVFYELGLAHAIGRDAVLLSQSIDDVPFDLRHWRCILYRQTIEGSKSLAEALQKSIVKDADYSTVPVELLTDKFTGGYLVERAQTIVTFDEPRGMQTLFREKWEITPTRGTVLDELYRKIRSDGTLRDVRSEGCDITQKEFMRGLHLLRVKLPSPVRRNDRFRYGLEYHLINGFPASEEFWAFDFECDTRSFEYVLRFLPPCPASDVTAVLRVGGKDSPVPVVRRGSRGAQEYRIVLSDIAHGSGCMFRWKWA